MGVKQKKSKQAVVPKSKIKSRCAPENQEFPPGRRRGDESLNKIIARPLSKISETPHVVSYEILNPAFNGSNPSTNHPPLNHEINPEKTPHRPVPAGHAVPSPP